MGFLYLASKHIQFPKQLTVLLKNKRRAYIILNKESANDQNTAPATLSQLSYTRILFVKEPFPNWI